MAKEAIVHDDMFYRVGDIVNISYHETPAGSFNREDKTCTGRITHIYNGRLTVDCSDKYDSDVFEISIFSIDDMSKITPPIADNGCVDCDECPHRDVDTPCDISDNDEDCPLLKGEESK